MRTYYIGLALVTAAAGLSNLSCSAVECGSGTIERDGLCFPADDITTPAGCGGIGPFATVLGLDGKCEAETPTICDEDTTREEIDMDTGVTTCIGTAGGCGSEIDCTAPSANRATVCGRIWDTGTDTLIAQAAQNPEMPCGTPTTDGPCSLRVRFFDAVDFAANPMGAMPLSPEGGVYQDGCGRFRGHNMQRATLGFIGIGVDDAPGITPAVPHVTTGVALANEAANPARGFRAYSTTVQTDTDWHTSSMIGGQTFAQRGVLAIVYHYKGVPQAGVTARRNGNPIPTEDFYFSDTGVARTTVAAAQTSTGANGTALVIGTPSHC